LRTEGGRCVEVSTPSERKDCFTKKGIKKKKIMWRIHENAGEKIEGSKSDGGSSLQGT